MNAFRHAGRQLLKHPGFTATAVLTLAIGIGANTAIFSLVNELLLRPMAVNNPEELLGLVLIDRSGDYSRQNIPYPIYRDYQEQNQAFAALMGYATVFSSMQIGEVSRPGLVQLASANYFRTLGVIPAAGRTFLLEDDRSEGQPPQAVISHACWQNQFQADPSVIGRTFTLRPNYAEPLICTVIGVAPPRFSGLDERIPDVWLTAVMAEHFRKASSVNFRLVGRLAPGVSRRQATAALDVVARTVAEKYRGVPLPGYGNEGIFRSDLKTELRPAALGSWGAFKPRAEVRRATTLALAVVGLVLLIACANVSNLLLARAATRRKEIAIRLSLGADRWQLFRPVLTESLVLSLLGGLLGMLLARWINQALVALKPIDIALVVATRLDHRVIGFTLLVSVLAGLIFGTAPAWQTASYDLNAGLKVETLSLDRRRRFHLRDVLVTGQIALCLLLLIGAGLCVRSFGELLAANPGFRTREVFVVPLQAKGYTEKTIGPFYDDLAQRLAALPGIRSVSYARSFPMLDGGGASFPAGEIDGYTPQKDEFINVQFAEVGPNYFETLGIPIRQSPDIALPQNGSLVWVNESFVQRYWPDQAPVGRRVGRFVVNGVVQDSQIRNLTEKPGPYLYLQTAQPRTPSLVLMVRAEGDARDAIAAVRQEIGKGHGEFDLSRIQSIRQVLAGSLRAQRFLMTLLGAFAATATLLATLGIYGVMSHSVTQRTREIGIRMAVGARRRNVLALVLKRGMGLTLAGIGIGLVAAAIATRVLANVLYGVSPTDLLTFASISLLLGAVAFIACVIPARRAAGVDPMKALRTE